MKAPRLLLRVHVKEVILERILSGEYEPGERLVETRLAREFETSQVPVREALRDLESLRLVESEPFRGARVRKVSRQELVEIYPIRSAIEEVAVRQATIELDGHVRELELHLVAMEKAAGEGDRHEQVRSDVAFHQTIVDASGNAILGEVWRSLRIEGRTMITTLRTGIKLEEIAAIHEPILRAIRVKDPDAAAAAMRRHFDALGSLLEERDI
ncbi:MAG: GntR family transcriptional regulator [Actinobacteria bacterium]|nr:GntR family transcriptional regulator [Actinomycetota bacterium]